MPTAPLEPTPVAVISSDTAARHRFHLLRHYTVASATIITVIAVLAALAGAYLVHNAYIQLEREEADSIAENMLLDMAPLGLEQSRWPKTAESELVQKELRSTMRNFEISELLVIQPDGRVLTRLHAPGLPERPLWAEGLEGARRGRVVSRWESERWGPFVLLGDKAGWIETYVPVRDGREVVAVARVQRNLEHVVAQDHQILGYLLALTLASAIAVFFALRYTVALAHRTIRAQQAEIEKINAQMEQTNQRLVELDRRKDEFLAICSHDVRSPLTGIHAGCQVLLKERQGPLNAIQREIVQNNLAAAKSVLALTNGLLDLARIEAGQECLVPERFSLNEVLRESAASHSTAAESRGVTFQLDLADPDLELHTDRVKVLRVCNNLVSNAVKHSPATPVRIATRRDGQTLHIDIHDQGPGIRPEDVAKLFDRFSVLAAKKRTREEGTGLGLSITRALVELMGGTLTVVSEVGKGSTFAFTLPLQMPTDRLVTPAPVKTMA